MKNVRTLSAESYLLKVQRTLFYTGIFLATLVFAGCAKKDLSGSKLTTGATASGNTAAVLNLPTREEAKLAMEVFNNRFYRTTIPGGFKGYYLQRERRTNRMFFWWQAESIETLIDAYIINPNEDFLNKIHTLYAGLIDEWGTDWSHIDHFDDRIWGVLMSARAYLITNSQQMLNIAEQNFNSVWNEAYDDVLGGGLYWHKSKQTKNACINAPAALAAAYLYYLTRNISYYNKSRQLLKWTIDKLYDRNTGEVKDMIGIDGTVYAGTTTYNQGTFIGACGELENLFHGEFYEHGLQALSYTKNSMTYPDGLLQDEDNNGNPDTPGFKGIFARWACKFIGDFHLQSRFGDWIDYNATQAWKHRNSRGVMWHIWNVYPPESDRFGWAATSGVSMMNAAWLIHP